VEVGPARFPGVPELAQDLARSHPIAAAHAAAYKELLTPEQYAAAVLNPGPPPGLEGYSAVERLSLEVSAAQMRQAQADTPLRRMSLVVLSHSRTLPNPFGFPPDWPAEALERAFQDSQDALAGSCRAPAT
jgi:hypothetical protein